ncbi:MAG: hypothetical protein OEY59_03790 [Deltaproteobacteria bacterium]|nr:hypothetical protein [Deltaproteobacteria bacterium]
MFLFFHGSISFAQGYDYIEDETSNLWEEERFVDQTGRVNREFDTSVGDYVGEEEVQEIEETTGSVSPSSRINIMAAIEKDKAILPDNVLFGLGTGVTVGGWFALLQGKNARENTRYLGMGIVLGTVLGLVVGTKSVFSDRAPLYYGLNENLPPDNHPLQYQFGFMQGKTGKDSLAQIKFQFGF